MDRISISNGEYLAVTPVVISRFTGSQQIDYCEIAKGERFSITAGSGYVAREYLTYHPDFGDPKPVVKPV